MQYSIEKVTPSSQDEMVHFLKQREDYSLFLLGNFENYGLILSKAPYSGNFKLIRSATKVCGVFCLMRSGTILIEAEAENSLFDHVLASCKTESLPITGLIGNWTFCHLFWDFLKNKNIIQTELFTSKEVLYNMDLSKVSPPSNSLTRLLAEEDYIKWKPLRLADLKEVGLPSDLSEAQMLELFMEKVAKKIIWGLFLEDELVSMAELNAKTAELGQLGGVYTHPSFRQKGYGRCMIQQLLWDIKHIHRIRKLIIFTDENNLPAKRLYESLGAIQIGFFSLLFGRP